MCVRLFHWSAEDVYKFFNCSDPRWPDNLPPPPNPDKFQQFMFAMVDVTVSQLNEENGGGKGGGGRPERRRI